MRKLVVSGLRKLLAVRDRIQIHHEQKAIVAAEQAQKRTEWSQLVYSAWNKNSHFPTASEDAIIHHGFRFFERFSPSKIPGKSRREFGLSIDRTSHESTVGVVLDAIPTGTDLKKGKTMEPIGTAKLGFTHNMVVIEALQGGGHQSATSLFYEVNHEPWANYMIHHIKQTAQKAGYRYVALRKPDQLQWYEKPVLTPYKTKTQSGIRHDMRTFYQEVAQANGFIHETKQWWILPLT